MREAASRQGHVAVAPQCGRGLASCRGAAAPRSWAEGGNRARAPPHGLPTMSNGYRTLSQHLNDLKKENFSLKLRIYFLEERMQQKYEASREDIYKRVSAGGAATPLGWRGASVDTSRCWGLFLCSSSCCANERGRRFRAGCGHLHAF